MRIKLLLLLLFVLAQLPSFALQIQIHDTVSTKEQRESVLPTAHLYYIVAALRDIKPLKKDNNQPAGKRSASSYLPKISDNPTSRAQIAIKAVGVKVLGNEPNTTMSIA